MGLAVLTALHGDHLLADPYRSYRQIGAGGLFWACILFAWVVPGLWREAGGGRRGKVLLRVATGCLFLAAPLWVGGPFGLTQALGEYLRPRTVRMVQPPILVRECSPGGKLPEGLMRQTEAVAASRHLTLQRVVTCESLFANARAPRDPANSARGQTLDCDVKFLEPADNMWAKTGCATFQFRRHFVVGAMYYDGEREIAVEAAMIQSRWDYLRQNWDPETGRLVLAVRGPQPTLPVHWALRTPMGRVLPIARRDHEAGSGDVVPAAEHITVNMPHLYELDRPRGSGPRRVAARCGWRRSAGADGDGGGPRDGEGGDGVGGRDGMGGDAAGGDGDLVKPGQRKRCLFHCAGGAEPDGSGGCVRIPGRRDGAGDHQRGEDGVDGGREHGLPGGAGFPGRVGGD